MMRILAYDPDATIQRPPRRGAPTAITMSTRHPTRIRSLLRLIALLLLASPGQAQESEAPPSDEAFFERVAVNIVNVEAYVTDKDGNPVPDLTAADFEVLEDGRPVEVVNFYRVADGRAEISAPPAPEETAAPEPAATEAVEPPTVEPEVPESQRLHLIVYVDNFNIHPLNRNRVFSRLRSFLQDNVQQGDQVMLASYDRSLHIRQPFTADPTRVNQQLFELENLTGYAAQREAERNDAVREIYEAQSLNEALRRAAEFSNNAHFELKESLQGLTEMVDSLAGLPGRKMLLHVSDGLPMVPGQDLYQAVQQRFADISALGEAIIRDESRSFMRMISRANSSRISFYTIDAGGLRTRSGFGAENRAANTSHVIGTAVDSVHTKNLRDTLILMANRTGGQAVYNTNDVSEGLERFARDFNNYYSLGYRAPADTLGRYHRIEVRLKEKQRGWRVRHREGYRDKSPDTVISDAMASHIVHGYQSNPLNVRVEIGQQIPDEDGMVDVAIRVRIPLAGVVLLPRPGRYEARLSIYLTVADKKGRQSPRQELPLELQIPEESLQMALEDDVTRVINATMRPGDHRLVIAVRDEISEERSVIGSYITVARGRGG
jgi:VWFA-related protein